jgi:hypothetical protein
MRTRGWQSRPSERGRLLVALRIQGESQIAGIDELLGRQTKCLGVAIRGFGVAFVVEITATYLVKGPRKTFAEQAMAEPERSGTAAIVVWLGVELGGYPVRVACVQPFRQAPLALAKMEVVGGIGWPILNGALERLHRPGVAIAGLAEEVDPSSKVFE